jgi:hypothetical protein
MTRTDLYIVIDNENMVWSKIVKNGSDDTGADEIKALNKSQILTYTQALKHQKELTAKIGPSNPGLTWKIIELYVHLNL